MEGHHDACSGCTGDRAGLPRGQVILAGGILGIFLEEDRLDVHQIRGWKIGRMALSSVQPRRGRYT